MSVKTHNILAVLCTIGPYNLKDGGSSEFITIEEDDGQWEATKGTHGEVVRSRIPGSSGKINITCTQAGHINKYLSQITENDKAISDSGAGSGVFLPFRISQPGGDDVKIERCWVEKRPGKAYNRSVGEVQWVLCFDEAQTLDFNGYDTSSVPLQDLSSFVSNLVEVTDVIDSVIDLVG